MSEDELSVTLRTPSSGPRSAPSLQQLPRIEPYEPGSLLGRGGMGEVRLCHDLRLGRQIALKTATTRNPEELERFVREAQVQGQLEHPSIVPVHELGVSADGAPFFTMKRIRGETLHEILRQLQHGSKELRHNRHRLLTAFLSVCQAVEYAHTNGWIHRDLKPANIMLGDFGEVYVLDWGLALRSDAVEHSADPLKDLQFAPVGATTPGTLLGTPGYMAPEQVLGQPAGVASDVYALGAVLFEVLTHRLLATGNSVMELLVNTRDGVDARARLRAPEHDVSPELEAICVKATRLKAAERYTSVRELHDAVERVLAGERNLQLRSSLADSHAANARAVTEKVGAGGTDALELRRIALREAGMALALDPAHRVALQTLVELLTQQPKVLPPEAEAEIQAGHLQQVRSSGRAAMYAFLVTLVDVPLMFAMGIRQTWMLVLSYGLVTAAAAAAGFAGYLKRVPTLSSAMPVLLLSNLAISSLSLVTGPFLIVPAYAATNTIAFVVFLPRRYRALVVSLGVATVALPLVATWLGLMPPSYRFVAEGMLILPQAVELTQTLTLLLLTFASIGVVVVSSLVVGYVRDRFDELESRRAAESWNLKQLIPADARPPPEAPIEACDLLARVGVVR